MKEEIATEGQPAADPEVIHRLALRTRPFLLGHARFVGKTLFLHTHNETVRPVPGEIIGIRFRPMRKAGADFYKAFLVLWPDVIGPEATAPDVALVAGRPWFDACTTQARRRVHAWLRGRCECCGRDDAWPSLLEDELVKKEVESASQDNRASQDRCS